MKLPALQIFVPSLSVTLHNFHDLHYYGYTKHANYEGMSGGYKNSFAFCPASSVSLSSFRNYFGYAVEHPAVIVHCSLFLFQIKKFVLVDVELEYQDLLHADIMANFLG
jgi:hypothetical protein